MELRITDHGLIDVFVDYGNNSISILDDIGSLERAVALLDENRKLLVDWIAKRRASTAVKVVVVKDGVVLFEHERTGDRVTSGCCALGMAKEAKDALSLAFQSIGSTGSVGQSDDSQGVSNVRGSPGQIDRDVPVASPGGPQHHGEAFREASIGR